MQPIISIATGYSTVEYHRRTTHLGPIEPSLRCRAPHRAQGVALHCRIALSVVAAPVGPDLRRDVHPCVAPTYSVAAGLHQLLLNRKIPRAYTAHAEQAQKRKGLETVRAGGRAGGRAHAHRCLRATQVVARAGRGVGCAEDRAALGTWRAATTVDTPAHRCMHVRGHRHCCVRLLECQQPRLEP